MSPRITAVTTATRERIDRYLPVVPDHLRPILLGVRDHGIGWATVPQKAGAFDLPMDRPTVVVVGDDLDTSLGPAGFHRRSIRCALAQCRLVSVVACEALPICYVAAAGMAVGFGQHAAIIETRPEHELEWIALVKRVAPDAQLIIASVKETRQ